jgi:hypothetical protein
VLGSADGSRFKTVLHVPPSKSVYYGSAAWSKDGSRFAIYAARERLELRLFDADGTFRRVFRSAKLDVK